jgi:hypothetical protein
MGRWFTAIEPCLQFQAKSSRVDDGVFESRKKSTGTFYASYHIATLAAGSKMCEPETQREQIYGLFFGHPIASDRRRGRVLQ